MIETVSSRTAYENRWVTLREDAIRYADGTDGVYTYIERPRFAIVAAVEAGRIWMVEQYRHPLGARSLELPMGVAPGGAATPIEEAAAIELREETGVHAARFDHVGEIAPAPALLAQTGALFLATGLTEGAQALEPTEQDLIAMTLRVEEALEAACAGRIRDAATLAALGLLRIKNLI